MELNYTKGWRNEGFVFNNGLKREDGMSEAKSLVRGLTDLHREIIMQAAMGSSPSEIAKMFALSVGNVGEVLKTAQGLQLTKGLDNAKKVAIEKVELELSKVVVTNVKLLKDTIEGRVETLIEDLDEDGQLIVIDGEPVMKKTYEIVDLKMRVDTLFKAAGLIGLTPIQRGEINKNVRIGLIDSQDVLDEISLEGEVEAEFEEVKDEVEE